jgi:hypothetical protein
MKAKEEAMTDYFNDFKEEHILTHCALRFDGYAYREATGFHENEALEDFLSTGQWNITTEEQLTAFFLLQRFLMKWGGEYLSERGKEWRAFRSLFLLTCEYEIPPKYRFNGEYEVWEKKYRPRHAECVQTIRHIHETTDYDDSVIFRE